MRLISMRLGFTVLLAIGADVHAQSGGAYEVLRAPGADQTIPYGVNNAGDTVGVAVVCEPSGGPAPGQWGFLLHKGRYAALVFPGALSTVPRAISERGEVVGYYYGPDLMARGFRFWRGRFETLPIPGDNVFAMSVNARGQIVGSIVQPTGAYSSFVLSRHNQLEILTPPSGSAVWNLNAVGINNSGTVVGLAESTTGGSFVYTRRHLSFFPFTTILGVNERGDVLGSPAGEPRTVYRKGEPLQLNVPATFHLPLGLSNTSVVGMRETTVDGDCFRGDGFRVRY